MNYARYVSSASRALEPGEDEAEAAAELLDQKPMLGEKYLPDNLLEAVEDESDSDGGYADPKQDGQQKLRGEIRSVSVACSPFSRNNDDGHGEIVKKFRTR